jgi:hypothetical protein
MTVDLNFFNRYLFSFSRIQRITWQMAVVFAIFHLVNTTECCARYISRKKIVQPVRIKSLC